MCLVALITVELLKIGDIIGSFGSLVASSASSDEVEVKISTALIALTDFSVFENSIGSLAAQNTDKSVSAIRAAEIFISILSEEADEARRLPKLPIIPQI